MILSLPNATGDVALTHDGVGTAFAAVCNGADIWLDRMSGAAWDTMALQIPPVNAASGNPDRPFLLGDRRTSEVLFLSWGDSSPAQGTLAEFSYSTGSALSTTNGAWCPQYTLPSTVGCAAIFGSSCQMVQDSAGDVWIAIPGDRDCDQQSPLDGIVSPIGVRRFVGDTNICSNAVEAPLSAPECLYVSTGAPVDLSRTEPPDLEFKHFTLSLSAAGDSPRLNLAFYAFRELATGRPCPASGSSICRSDVLHVQRSPSGLWCNPQGACQDPNRTCGHNASCGIHVADLDTGELNPIFTVANADPPGRSSHILPAVVSLDYGQLAVSWYDFADSSLSIPTYTVVDAWARFHDGPTTIVSTRIDTPSSQVGTWFNRRLLSDVDTAASAHLHAHWVRRFIAASCMPPLGSCPGGDQAWVWSPRSPAR